MLNSLCYLLVLLHNLFLPSLSTPKVWTYWTMRWRTLWTSRFRCWKQLINFILSNFRCFILALLTEDWFQSTFNSQNSRSLKTITFLYFILFGFPWLVGIFDLVVFKRLIFLYFLNWWDFKGRFDWFERLAVRFVIESKMDDLTEFLIVLMMVKVHEMFMKKYWMFKMGLLFYLVTW